MGQKQPSEFSHHLSSVLREAAATNLKHRYYCGLVFRRQMAELSKQLNMLNESSVRLEQFSAIERERLRPQQEKESRERELKQLGEKLAGTESQLSELYSLKKVLEDSVSDPRHAACKESHEMALADRGKSLAEKQAIESAVFSVVAPSSRTFKKYIKLCNLDARMQGLLQLYIEDPASAAAADVGKDLRIILDDIRRVSKQLSLDAKDLEKLSLLYKHVEDGSFSGMASRLGRLRQQLVEKEALARTSAEALLVSQSEFEAAAREKSMVESRISSLEEIKRDLLARLGPTTAG